MRFPVLASPRTLCGLIAVVAALGAGCSSGTAEGERERDEEAPFSTTEWDTDFAERSIELDEIMSGGPPKDGIPSIDEPSFVSVGSAEGFLEASEPVAVLRVRGEARIYPFQILVWHEIVNDVIGGEPVAITYCPLCNSTVAFRREVDGRVLDFGTTGKLRGSDLVMYDRQTETWWQQLTAEAIVGELTGTKLELLPAQSFAWEEARRQYPEAEVLSRETGFERNYGTNPYPGYDDPQSQPFALDGEADDRLPPKERVTSIKSLGPTAVVYPFSRLAAEAPLNDEIGGRQIVVLFDAAVSSALDAAQVADGRDVGAATVFERRLGDRVLSFAPASGSAAARDRQTGSSWSSAGVATSGPLEGEQLRPITSDDQLWFAVAAFFEDVEIRG